MDAQRFFSVAYDSRNHPKVRMLRMRGDGIAEYGRYVALLGILYDMGNRIDATDDAMLEYLAYELDLRDGGETAEWLRAAAGCGLIDPGALEEFGVVTSNGVGRELEYKAMKSAAGKQGGRPRKAGAKAAVKAGAFEK